MVEGLKAKFNGLKDKPQAAKAGTSAKDAVTSNRASVAKKAKAAPKSDKRFITGVDVGDAPVRRKVKPIVIIEDDGTTED